MKEPTSPLTDFIAQLSVQVTGGISDGQGFLRKHPVTRSFCSLLPPVSSPQFPTKIDSSINCQTQGPFTHIIIICLSYPEMIYFNGTKMSVQGAKNDFSLLLNHFGYFCEHNPIRFTLLNDFEYLFDESASYADVKQIPKADTSKEAIKRAIKSALRQTTQDSKVLFYFTGHGTDDQAVIAGDGQPIYGSELRSWLCATRRSSVPVTAVFDCCQGGGSLGLSYIYEETPAGIEVQETSKPKRSNPILQISAAPQGQSALSTEFSGGYHGQLTWYFLRYLQILQNNPSKTTIDDVVHFVNKRFAQNGSQTPQFTCSRNLEGQFPFF